MIDHLTATYALSREDAYLLCSLAVDLKISEIVDAGVYIVSALLPEAIFTSHSAACRTLRATGAAAVPPNPAPTSITATATFGFCAGAKATNQASASLGFLEFGHSSAVPVLPATVTPGSAPALPVPPWMTAIIIERTWPATVALTARLWWTLVL